MPPRVPTKLNLFPAEWRKADVSGFVARSQQCGDAGTKWSLRPYCWSAVSFSWNTELANLLKLLVVLVCLGAIVQRLLVLTYLPEPKGLPRRRVDRRGHHAGFRDNSWFWCEDECGLQHASPGWSDIKCWLEAAYFLIPHSAAWTSLSHSSASRCQCCLSIGLTALAACSRHSSASLRNGVVSHCRMCLSGAFVPTRVKSR
jgi:hypothetical protein